MEISQSSISLVRVFGEVQKMGHNYWGKYPIVPVSKTYLENCSCQNEIDANGFLISKRQYTEAH